jgi:phosphoribosylglycinamide formyltransferase-1
MNVPATVPINIVVFASGAGSNLRALVDARASSYRVAGVVADHRAAGALDFAEQNGIPYAVIHRSHHASGSSQASAVLPAAGETRVAWEARLRDAAQSFRADWVVLAGFMFLLRGPMLDAFNGRILNIHPSLLPAFPGLDSPRQALEAGASVTGCTVHLVDAGMDTGPILAQARVPIATGDTVASLHQRIQVAEHKLFPYVVDLIARQGVWASAVEFDATTSIPVPS